MIFSTQDIENFSQAVESLKKYRRADIIDEDGKNILDILYTDLLPNDYILKKCLFDNTTFLIGRKGTGKSTVFLKMEIEIRKKPSYLPCYIDVKTIYESSEAQAVDYDHLKEYLAPEVLEKYILERNFIQNVLKAIKRELEKKYSSTLERLLSSFINTKASIVKDKINNLAMKIENNTHLKEIELPLIKQRSMNITQGSEVQKGNSQTKGQNTYSASLKADSLNLTSKSNANKTSSNLFKETSGNSMQFTDVFLKVFQIKDVINEVKEILTALDIKHLIILLDDLSEINDEAIKTFIDTIVAPLNNWSEEFIKFKIAVYPNRLHYGRIDPGKIDSINLDFYNLYSEFDRNKMEEYAVDFTSRLIEKRISYFTKQSVEYFFDTSKASIKDYYELLFQVSMNVPRILGYILSYCHQNRIIFQKKITKSDIEAAAEKYYNEKIDTFFHKNIYSLMSLDEKISIFQFNELIKLIVKQLNEVKKKIVAKELKGKIYLSNSPYSSHFNVSPDLEKILNTLELNHFVSKYDEMINKDGKPVYIYCINYGLSQKNNIYWGKPKGNEYRKYFIERPFSFTKTINEFIATSKKIQCQNCGKLFKLEELPFLEFSNNKCNDCDGVVKVESFSPQILQEINKIDKRKLLPKEYMEILIELSNFNNSYKFAREIAEELDYSKRIIAWKCKSLDEKYGLVERDKSKDPYKYRLTQKAIDEYISDYKNK